MADFKLGNHVIGPRQPTYFIADIAANHDGELQRAKDLIYLAKESGADAAKFQNFRAEKIVSKVGFESLAGKLSHQAKWKKSVFQVYQDASLSLDWTPILKETCDRAGIEYFTSPYDFAAVDAVDPYVGAYKVGSGDIDWPEILAHIAQKGKPIFVATGASSQEDVDRAMKILLAHTNRLVLMQCNTNYTGDKENFHYLNLRVLLSYAHQYPAVTLGLSDHTAGHSSVLGAVALGARAVEKHFTDDNNREGPDHPFAMNPRSWREMVERTRELEAALGDGIKRVEKNELNSLVVQRRSLRATRDLRQGEVLQAGDLEPLRPIPHDGIAPHRQGELLGRRLKRDLPVGQHITWEHV
jgi:N-acetylneuraminate synthase